MAHTKAQGSVKGNRDSRPKRLGIKKYGGQTVTTGNIIVRQKGTKYAPGDGVSMGKDYTIFALLNGTVSFTTRMGKKVVNVVNG